MRTTKKTLAQNGRPVSGIIRADSAYTTDDLIAKGYGHETLRNMRAGGVKPGQGGRRAVYFGDEIIAWLKRNRDESNQTTESR